MCSGNFELAYSILFLPNTGASVLLSLEIIFVLVTNFFLFSIVVLITLVGNAARNVSQVTMVAVSLATARDAIVMHVDRQAVSVMTSLENVPVNQG
jgi:hypothetical protein